MSQLFLRLFASAFFINFCSSVHVSIEDGKRVVKTKFPGPVLDGFILTTEKNMEVLEILKFEENERKEITLVGNFPDLKLINMSYLNLEKIPKFMNLPNAEWLAFTSNKISRLPHNSISTLPLIEISFAGNEISTIDDNAIGANVTDINFDCNMLTEISPKWFKNPGKLQILGLRHNRIIFIDENLTQFLSNISSLDLAYNKIISIGNGAFSGVSHMMYLNFQANQLSVIQPEIFGPSINITRSFNIGRNRLNFLSKDLLKKLSLREFVILGNPFQCPCLREIEKWMAKNVKDPKYDTYLLKWKESNPVCIVGTQFANQCVELVDEELYNSYAVNLNVVDDVCNYIV